ncbi:MAG: hypothetical protein E7218_07760 [Anaerofustis stercorihominis]|nr:hypothetical protein [Anaerofustis stercorihominis]
MKKKTIALLLAMLLLTAFACGNDDKVLMPSPEFPIEKDVLSAELAELRMEYDIYDVDYPNEGSRGYGLNNPGDEHFVVVGISTHDEEVAGKKFIGMSFVSYYTKTSIKLSDSEKFFTLASKLYGGFETETQVWETFNEEFGKKNTETKTYDVDVNQQFHQAEMVHTWTTKIEGITCEVRVEQPDSAKDEMYIQVLKFEK